MAGFLVPPFATNASRSAALLPAKEIMEQRIIKMAPPAPGGQIEPTYETVISALRELVKASQIIPREFPASYHERFYYARKHAELILEAVEHRVQSDACPVCAGERYVQTKSRGLVKCASCNGTGQRR